MKMLSPTECSRRFLLLSNAAVVVADMSTHYLHPPPSPQKRIGSGQTCLFRLFRGGGAGEVMQHCPLRRQQRFDGHHLHI
jgi:hypothetical protein